MSDYRYSERADRELQSILRYSVQQFGLRQTEIYKASLENCFSTLAEHPRMGRLAAILEKKVRRHDTEVTSFSIATKQTIF